MLSAPTVYALWICFPRLPTRVYYIQERSSSHVTHLAPQPGAVMYTMTQRLFPQVEYSYLYVIVPGYILSVVSGKYHGTGINLTMQLPSMK